MALRYGASGVCPVVLTYLFAHHCDICTSSVDDGQGSLVCCSPWDCRVGHAWVTELNCDTRAPSGLIFWLHSFTLTRPLQIHLLLESQTRYSRHMDQAVVTHLPLVQFSCLVVSNSLQPNGLQHTRLPCPSPTPRVYSNSCPLSQWCHPTISSFAISFSSCLQSFPVSGSFQMSQFFASGGQSIGVSASASVLPMNIQDWFPLGCTGWISLQSKGLSRVFSNTTVQEHRFFGAQLSL